MAGFADHGVAIICNVLSEDALTRLRSEADRLAAAAGTACVRHIRAKSVIFDALAQSEPIIALLGSGDSLIPVRSILFDKTPAENWPVAWHQDLTIAVREKVEAAGYGPWSVKDGVVHVQPPAALLDQMVTVRIHLDDTPASNGALRVIPGSHRQGRIAPAEISTRCGDGEFVCACAAGDVLLMKPLILHASSRSELPLRRRIVHFEYAPADALDPRLAWHEGPMTS